MQLLVEKLKFGNSYSGAIDTKLKLDYQVVTHCPFCPEKIEITVKEIKEWN